MCVNTGRTSTAKYFELFRGICLIKGLQGQRWQKSNMADSAFLRAVFSFKNNSDIIFNVVYAIEEVLGSDCLSVYSGSWCSVSSSPFVEPPSQP